MTKVSNSRLNLGAACHSTSTKVHDEGLSRPRTIIIGNSFRGAVEPKVLNFRRKFRRAAEAEVSGLYISPEPKVLEECQLKSK